MAYSLAFQSAIITGQSGGVATDSLTLPSGTDQTLVVFIPSLGNAGRDITSVTWGGVALTRRGFYSSTSATILGIYTLRNPAAGTANLVTTINQSTSNFARSIVLAEGVGDFAAIQDAYDANAATVASATGGVVLGIGFNRSATVIAEDAGQTSIHSAFGPSLVAFKTTSEAGATSVTTGFTFTGGDSRMTVGVALAPAASTTIFRPYFITG